MLDFFKGNVYEIQNIFPQCEQCSFSEQADVKYKVYDKFRKWGVRGFLKLWRVKIVRKVDHKGAATQYQLLLKLLLVRYLSLESHFPTRQVLMLRHQPSDQQEL